jgi:hypothetical protein
VGIFISHKFANTINQAFKIYFSLAENQFLSIFGNNMREIQYVAKRRI